MKGKSRTQRGKPGTVRIIGGEWRGRRLPVPDVVGLRPSGDRGRETLFNWLRPYLPGARCVDLFAGTGVLGLEAVSRGAAFAVLVDKSQSAVKVMQRSVDLLGAAQVTVVRADALDWLEQQPAHLADIVLVDPPFGQALAERAMRKLEATDSLRPGGVVYLESARADPVPVAGPDWESLKEQAIGEVRMQLFRQAPARV